MLLKQFPNLYYTALWDDRGIFKDSWSYPAPRISMICIAEGQGLSWLAGHSWSPEYTLSLAIAGCLFLNMPACYILCACIWVLSVPASESGDPAACPAWPSAITPDGCMDERVFLPAPCSGWAREEQSHWPLIFASLQISQWACWPLWSLPVASPSLACLSSCLGNSAGFRGENEACSLVAKTTIRNLLTTWTQRPTSRRTVRAS